MRVLVVGDTILDAFIYGSVSRVNPEAPYSTVFDLDGNQKICLGGAANVAANIKSLNKDISVNYLGYVSESVADLLTERDIAFKPSLMVTDEEILLKTRFVCDNHYLLRVDRGKKYEKIDKSFFADVLNGHYDLVVFSDYDKGSIHPGLFLEIRNKDLKVLIDGKKIKNLAPIPNKQNCILKCNKVEFEEFRQCKGWFKVVVQTLGKEGFDVHEESYVDHFNAHAVTNLSDNVGAGDSFLAGMACWYLENKIWNPFAMAKFGNVCASEKVKVPGTHAVELKKEKHREE
jgi:bifunctional ADP-heptose synthase (sugar kinase/adenylyltransferase)